MWPRIEKSEIENSIFSSSIKKASESDEISFAIIQKVYLSISEHFYKLYSSLLETGFYSKYWRVATEVILKKSASVQRDWSKPKSYRVVSLLNCLSKVSEKLLATRLFYLAENSEFNSKKFELLYYNQIGRRKQKSAIDTVLLLVYNIQLKKYQKKQLSVLFLDIKRAFDYISKNQLLRICIKLKLPIFLIK